MSSYLGLYSFNSALENITNHGELKEMPEISEIRNYEQMRFFCDDDKNLGIPNYLFLVPLVLLDKRMNFVQLNMEPPRSLKDI
jgi:hypothetical protein